ncbi:ribonuclease H-like domain-containing protein [Paenibacillus sp. LHD-117]|uniref:ribonuclease H-like domain-containing protein n=1 Tax=Paenibacillus sp. LHD-117 TaxID=3071412 RepID=UPI0027DF5FF4|nr:ribonuclease H-like domain-containing protein [Paenibacillus sp. LHD-117]MDQ6418091.1 ribonuclease H-like domain-containing protein [Paenibacillus sp. LHD-117]
MRDRMNRLRGTGGAVSGGTGSDGDPNAVATGTIAEEQPAESSERTDIGKSEPPESLHPAWSSFGVTLRRTAKGDYLLRRSEYTLTHRHGTHALGELAEAAPGLTGFHADLPTVDPEQVLYLDLETTGLGVGAGNIPFMIGLAFLQGDRFVVEQSLIRHPAEEYAMLHDLEERLRNYRYLATYNGKTFDWPLVQNRMIMNAIGRTIRQPRHLDFLHPSRSVWRNTLASCKLSYIEEERLGITRTEDVPGSLAPQLYFQFLADGNPAPLEGVFTHNELDLLSLACLSIRFGHLLKEDIFRRIPYPEETEELIRTGLWLEKMGKSGLTEELYGIAAEHHEPSPSSLMMLAARDKKAGNWERAVVLWQKVISRTNDSILPAGQEACIELSMYYEHRTKELELSLQHARTAFARHERMYGGHRRDAKRSAEMQNIRKRIQRIENKMIKLESGALPS